MASQNFTNLSDHLARAKIDFSTVTVKGLLIDNVAVLTETQLDTWVDRADVTNEHAVSGNYVDGGFACTVTIGAVDTATNKTPIDIIPTAGNGAAVFSNSTISSLGCILYVSTGVEANDLLICFVDFGGEVNSSDADFKVTLSTDLEVSV